MKRIPLTQGKFALVDDEDFERLSKWRWHLRAHGRNLYAARQIRIMVGFQRAKRMHQEIVTAPPGMVVDHIDGNGLNNQKANLRVCTHAQNSQNSLKRKRSASKYKGVSLHWKCKQEKSKAKRRWFACIRVSGTIISLRLHKTQKEAALAYDAAAKKYFGEFAKLNFPEVA